MKPSNKCVFISHCVFAQTVRADGCAHAPAVIKEVVQFLMDHDINIMQMPCPETLTASGGLDRPPHGKKWYEGKGLRETCAEIASGQVDYMERLIRSGREVLGVIGIEFSPACAPNYLSRGRSVTREQGILVEELERELARRGLRMRFVGVHHRWHRKLARDLDALVGDSTSPQHRSGG